MIEVSEDDGTMVLELSVDEDDYGNVIGRGGRTASALRTVVKTAAQGEAPRVRRHRRLLMSERPTRLAACRHGRQPARARRQLSRGRRPTRRCSRSTVPSGSPSPARSGGSRAGRGPMCGRSCGSRAARIAARRRRCAARSCSSPAARRPRSRRTSGGPRTSRAAPSTTEPARSGPSGGCWRCPRARCSRCERAGGAASELLVPLVSDAVRVGRPRAPRDRHRSARSSGRNRR